MEEGEECLCPGNGNRLDKFTIEKAEAKTLDFGSDSDGFNTDHFRTIVFERAV